MLATKLIGRSLAHQRLVEKLSRIAPTDAEVLISGESGVGKELYARYVHHHSTRDKASFVPVNCGALPNELLENELFGHVGGAFTGARPQSEGLVAEAEHGTLFLDEIDSLSTPSQVKLLRFLQEKEYRRLGETRTRRSNVRVIAATNIDLLTAMRDGRFREDLYFRLRVVPVEVPPLRERPEDIRRLIAYFIERSGRRMTVTPEALRLLERYRWPGNVRELQN
ncbi:MAG TPA: sigma 54-interacting transcriptional regulator, partial [Pyrinomonadaceae bacterium]|nr:sigma 54-interacting transcriptional regulator [Pyrinomonadaceae bacterium]